MTSGAYLGLGARAAQVTRLAAEGDRAHLEQQVIARRRVGEVHKAETWSSAGREKNTPGGTKIRGIREEECANTASEIEYAEKPDQSRSNTVRMNANER